MQRLVAFILASATVAGFALAQTPYEPPSADDPPSGGLEEDLENGIQGFLEKLMNEVQPHLDQLGRDLNDTVNSFTPVFDEIGNLMDDVGNYQTPERLENGDILIRRRADAPPAPEIGETLQDLLKPLPQPETAPSADAPPAEAPPKTLPETDPGSEIEL
ncbi:hypothetical protein [Paracoccus ravus]|uniref:hypothetical protein n=1 Tax=Paracoccus ravus TaxID=2447760 RepID=UPI00106E9709|nr:hypothetical protein [Paracoccus ravus]